MSVENPEESSSAQGRERARRAAKAIVERLHLMIYLSDLTQRDVEERVGFSRGYLSHILGGAVEVKLWQVLAILDALGVDPADFFSELFPRHRNRALGALDDFRDRTEKPLSLELARLYAYGIESISDFCERLELCEEALAELEDLGVFE